MEPIEKIDIPQVIVPQIDGRSWMYQIPAIPNNDPPVTIQLGFPIVELPGCIEAHPDNKIGSNNLPLDRNLVNDDPNGVTILCPNGEYPSYNALNYEPEQIIPTTAAPPPPVAPPAPEIPNTGDIVSTKKETECPAPNQPRIGDVAQNQKEKVSGYELRDGICVILYEDIGIVEQYLPSAQVVATTGGIAVVATTSALLAKPLADLLLKVIKPVVKKVIAKVQKILGKEQKKPTRSEILTKKYRQQKGLE
tara:strand:+ start:1824 stop:2573 length:750 start_codon:yes stop_codon:yes gene_type:complete